MKTTARELPNRRLREEREQRGWSQKYVASHIGAERYYISRWERGKISPSAHYRQRLCALFGKSARELGFLATEPPDDASPPHREAPLVTTAFEADRQTGPYWYVPFGRNPFFTGREAILRSLQQKLHREEHADVKLPLALSGLGGVGKTQLAIEYAFRYRADYLAVLWIGADTREGLLASCSVVADVLRLSAKDDQDQRSIIPAVRRWLSENDGWLLILDNIEDFTILHELIPAEHAGRVLLTTRSQVFGPLAECVDVEKMSPEEGALLLLRRAKVIAPDAALAEASVADRDVAGDLVHLMDGFPLALDQAAAYIDETACGLAGYRRRYETRRAKLLALRGLAPDHPASVVTTLSLSFQKIQCASKGAAELLQCCAFLHPDAIPEEFFIEGAAELGPTLQQSVFDLLSLDSTISELRTFSLLNRHPDACALNIHRIVQAVIRDTLDEATQKVWTERVIRALNRAFPDVAFASWQRCQRLLPHALECLALAKQWNVQILEAARLFDQAGTYLREHAQYDEAEPLYEQALAIRSQLLDARHADIAQSLHHLGLLYIEQDKYEQAEPPLIRALEIYKETLGWEHSSVASVLTSLAVLYDNEGKFDQSEPLYHQALDIYQRVVEPMHPDVATCLNNLGWLYLAQGKYAQAEPLYHRSLAIRKHVFEPGHPEIATSLNLLGWLYFAQGKYAQAEQLLSEALAIREHNLGSSHPDVAGTLNHLADLYRVQGTYGLAGSFLKQALTIREQILGPNHREVAQSLDSLGRLYAAQDMYDEAETAYHRALAIREQTLGLHHSSVAISLNNLADLYFACHKYDQVEPLCTQALEILKSGVGMQHPHVAASLNVLANLYCLQNRYDEAEPLYKQAIAIREQCLGPEHPDLVKTLTSYASMLRIMVPESWTGE